MLRVSFCSHCNLVWYQGLHVFVLKHLEKFCPKYTAHKHLYYFYMQKRVLGQEAAQVLHSLQERWASVLPQSTFPAAVEHYATLQ